MPRIRYRHRVDLSRRERWRRWLAPLLAGPARTTWLARFGVPVSVSLLVHAAALGALALIAWRFTHPPTPGSGDEVAISLEFPAPAPLAPPEPPAPPIPETPPPPPPEAQPEAAIEAPPEAPPDALPAPAPPSTLSPSMPLADGAPARPRAGALEAPQPGVPPAPAKAAATFAGASAQAATIVYVVDASGAMVSSLKFILTELERSVANLSPDQHFQVLIFRDRPPPGGSSTTPPPFDVFNPGAARRPALLRASAANKAGLSAWLAGIEPIGRSNPMQALRVALSFQPDVIFLLSRSIPRSAGVDPMNTLAGAPPAPPGSAWGRPLADLLDELDILNPRDERTGRRRVAIRAIQFLEDDPTGVMQAIADAHGGGPPLRAGEGGGDQRRAYSVLRLEDLARRGGAPPP